jgi:hypothetical protein
VRAQGTYVNGQGSGCRVQGYRLGFTFAFLKHKLTFFSGVGGQPRSVAVVHDASVCCEALVYKQGDPWIWTDTNGCIAACSPCQARRPGPRGEHREDGHGGNRGGGGGSTRREKHEHTSRKARDLKEEAKGETPPSRGRCPPPSCRYFASPPFYAASRLRCSGWRGGAP